MALPASRAVSAADLKGDDNVITHTHRGHVAANLNDLSNEFVADGDRQRQRHVAPDDQVIEVAVADRDGGVRL